MKKVILTAIIILSFVSAFSQNYIYRGDNQYKATNTWEFPLNGDYWTGNPKFNIAKHPNGGYLMISLDVPFKSNYIGGTVSVFLNDGTIIKCTDKGMRDHVDNQCIVLYNFTNSEIERLKLNRITRIRFTIIGGTEGPESYTADNNKSTSKWQIIGAEKEKNYYETNVEVTDLFE